MDVSCFMFHVSRKGFTLIEVLVVTAVGIFFSGIFLAYYNNYTNEKKLESETRKIADILDFAKKKSSAADASLCGDPATTPQVNGYSVVIYGGNQYKLVPNCTTGTPTEKIYPTIDQSLSFPTPTLSINFYNINAGGTAVATAACIKVQNSASNCKYIKVDAIGSITEISCPTPCP